MEPFFLPLCVATMKVSPMILRFSSGEMVLLTWS